MVSNDYIVGLTDGEGCFYVGVRYPKGPHKTVRVEPHFYIKLRGDDLPVLEEVKQAFGCGAIYYQNEKRQNHSACYRYEVNALRDLKRKIIPFFEKHPLHSKKKKEFEIFKIIFKLVEQRKHKIPEELRKIEKLKLAMNHRTRWVPEIGSPSGNGRQPSIIPIRQGSKAGNYRTPI